MFGSGLALLSMLLAPPASHAATFVVTNTLDSGAGSLREAIGLANTSAGPDRITFRAKLKGQTIKPLSQLPTIYADGTTIDGDLDNDAKPDIALNGSLQASGMGLQITGDSCVVDGLAVAGFQYTGINLIFADHCTIRACHLGINLPGTKDNSNGNAQVVIDQGTYNRIGLPGAPNVISGGTKSPYIANGIVLDGSQHNTIGPDSIGLSRSGTAAVSTGSTGVMLRQSQGNPACDYNTIADLVVAGVDTGVYLWPAGHTTIRHCTFGLAADGRTTLAPPGECIGMEAGSAANLIGGTTTADRNVFTGSDLSIGVFVYGVGTSGNRVWGNLFGMNAAGTERRTLAFGVRIEGDAAGQQIGGPNADQGNYFTANSSAASAVAVQLVNGGTGTLVQHNHIGSLANGQLVPLSGIGVWAAVPNIRVLDNDIARCDWGVWVGGNGGAAADASIYRNTFRACTEAVRVNSPGVARLGNLGNASSTDDGGNVFALTNSMDIMNADVPTTIRAEGNSFGTTQKSQIEAKIWDKRDDSSLGRVDYDPLKGGVHPTGGAENVALALTGVAAAPSRAGAEVVFTLSAPAAVTVEVLNIAGRVVAVPEQERPQEAGAARACRAPPLRPAATSSA
jgi:hypothetical protein